MNKYLLVFCLLHAAALSGFAQPCLFPYTQVDMGNLGECYPTRTNNPGHGLSGVAWLGPGITGEAEPSDSIDANNDGVAFFGVPWMPCTQVTVAVMVTAGPNYGQYSNCGGQLYLNAWKDGNGDGDFDDDLCEGLRSEWWLQDALTSPGVHIFEFIDPADSISPVGIFRFRLNSHSVGRYGYGMNDNDPACPQVLGNGPAIDSVGEVEDYVLPDFEAVVELISFAATPGDRIVTLNWTTAWESMVDYFELLRDGLAIAHVEATNGDTTHAYSYTDWNLVNGTAYTYALVAVDVNDGRHELATVSAIPLEATPALEGHLALDFGLMQNYPNPFNSSTMLSFALPSPSVVTLEVFDILGRQVYQKDLGRLATGEHRERFEGKELSSGIYFARVRAGTQTRLQKMALLR